MTLSRDEDEACRRATLEAQRAFEREANDKVKRKVLWVAFGVALLGALDIVVVVALVRCGL